MFPQQFSSWRWLKHPRGSPFNWSLGRQQKGIEEFCNKMRILCGRPPGTPWPLAPRACCPGFIDVAEQSFLLLICYLCTVLKMPVPALWETAPKVKRGPQTVIRCLALSNTPSVHPQRQRRDSRPQKERGKFMLSFCRQNIYTVLKATDTLIYKLKILKTRI